MSLDARLREGLQRSMSKLETDAELRLPDAHRRGRRRLLLRRVAVAVSVAASLIGSILPGTGEATAMMADKCKILVAAAEESRHRAQP